VKPRAWKSEMPGQKEFTDESRSSAITALRLGLSVLVRLFAPMLPYVTEEIWSWCFAQETAQPSVHKAPWPSPSELNSIPSPDNAKSFDLAVAVFSAINKAKADGQVSAGRVVERLVLKAAPETLREAAPIVSAAFDAARVTTGQQLGDDTLAPGAFAVEDAVFAPKPEKSA
jgi:valyl-tRNA synthetase